MEKRKLKVTINLKPLWIFLDILYDISIWLGMKVIRITKRVWGNVSHDIKNFSGFIAKWWYYQDSLDKSIAIITLLLGLVVFIGIMCGIYAIIIT